jgi:hypothetical protein
MEKGSGGRFLPTIDLSPFQATRPTNTWTDGSKGTGQLFIRRGRLWRKGQKADFCRLLTCPHFRHSPHFRQPHSITRRPWIRGRGRQGGEYEAPHEWRSKIGERSCRLDRCTRTRFRKTRPWPLRPTAGKELPVPLGNNFDIAVGHFYSGLIVKRVHRHW